MTRPRLVCPAPPSLRKKEGRETERERERDTDLDHLRRRARSLVHASAPARAGKGGQLIRSAGGFCTIIKKDSIAEADTVTPDAEAGGSRPHHQEAPASPKPADDTATLFSKGFATLKLTSGEVRKVPLACTATIGIVSNKNHHKQVYGKAGASRFVA